MSFLREAYRQRQGLFHLCHFVQLSNSEYHSGSPASVILTFRTYCSVCLLYQPRSEKPQIFHCRPPASIAVQLMLLTASILSISSHKAITHTIRTIMMRAVAQIKFLLCKKSCVTFAPPVRPCIAGQPRIAVAVWR